MQERRYRDLYQSYATVGGLSAPLRKKYLSLRQNVLPHIRGQVLEIGSGQGELLALCAESGIRARGCDVSPEMVAACQSRGLSVVRVDNTLEYLSATEPWDTLVMIDVLEHCTRDEALAIAKIASSKGQRILVQVPNMASPFATLNLYHDITHEWAYTEASIRQLLGLAGFHSVTVLPVDHVSHGLESVRKSLRRGLYALLWAILVIDQPNRSRVLTPNLLAIGDVRPMIDPAPVSELTDE